MQNELKKWVYLIILSLIWGSSFILIKKGLIGLTPLQLGSVRIIMTTIILSIFGWKELKKISKSTWPWVIFTGYFGTFFPSFLFAYAETIIDSSVAAVLSGMTPLFTMLLGLFVFGVGLKSRKALGVIIGFVGTLVLVSNEFSIQSGPNNWYALLIIIATFCYSINVNVIKFKLAGVSALGIALGNFIAIFIPAIIILMTSDFPLEGFIQNKKVTTSLGYIFILAFFGTALAKVMFNKLVSISSPVFSISITYLLPIVAIGWGILDGETFSPLQWLACVFILMGVYLVTENKPLKSKK